MGSQEIIADKQDADAPMPRLALRVTEAASTLGISRSKMYGLIRTGQVRSILVGDVMRVRVSDLTDYLEEMAVGN